MLRRQGPKGRQFSLCPLGLPCAYRQSATDINREDRVARLGDDARQTSTWTKTSEGASG